MAITSPSTIAAPVPAVVAPGTARSVQWGAVILGAVGASAISLVLLTFGAGIGLSAVSAEPYAGASAKAIAVISALYAAITMVASFGAGGYVTGRMRLPPTAEEISEADFRDGAHGFAVWAVAIVIGALLAASGISGALKTAMQTTAAVSAAAGAGAASNPAVASQISMTPTDYAMDRLLAPAPSADAASSGPSANPPTATSGTAPSAPAGSTAVRSRAEVSAPMNRSLAAALKTGKLEPRDRDALVQTVMQQTGLPKAEAEKRVDDAFADLKTAEQKARDAAERARKGALIAAFAAAATLLLACAAACAGAAAGAKHRHEGRDIILFGSRRFW
jgi:hypothetical protein